MARHLIKNALELKTKVTQALAQAREAALASGNPTNTRKRVNDGDGLRVDCTAGGNTSWQLVYRVPGQTAPKTAVLGPYPALLMKDARDLADALRVKLAQGVDPGAEKKSARAQHHSDVALVSGDKVSKVLGAYLDNCLEHDGYASTSVATMRSTFERDVYPSIGEKVARAVTPEDIEAILRRVEARRALESLRRIASWLRAGFKYGKIKPNPVRAVDMDDFQKRPRRAVDEHPGATDPKTLAQVLRTIDSYRGSRLVRAALLIHAHCFMRPDELRFAHWSQVSDDVFNNVVVLEGQRLDHLVPLTRQSKALFELLRPIHPTLVLPGLRHGKPLSNATLGRTLIGLGWQNVQTTHGFRKSASTLLNEMGWVPRHVDLQLSHKLTGPGTEGIYNKAKYLQQRIPMMACWSDYIDALIDPTSGADTMLPLHWRQQWDKKHPASI